jgi:hypothetical protein
MWAGKMWIITLSSCAHSIISTATCDLGPSRIRSMLSLFLSDPYLRKIMCQLLFEYLCMVRYNLHQPLIHLPFFCPQIQKRRNSQPRSTPTTNYSCCTVLHWYYRSDDIPGYSWNTVKVWVKHQLIYQIKWRPVIFNSLGRFLNLFNTLFISLENVIRFIMKCYISW